MNRPPFRDLPRRTLLATAGAGIASLGAGCLDDGAADSEPDDDDSPETDARSPVERWIPATESARWFTYGDLETMRAHLDADIVDELSPVDGAIERRLLEAAAADGEAAVEFAIGFGDDGPSNRVLSGSFDPAVVAEMADPEDGPGAFDIVEFEATTLAISAETIVFADDRATLEAILAAGRDGADRRVDADDAFEALLEHVADGTFTIGVVEGDEPNDDAFGTAASGYSWSIGGDRSTLTLTAVDDAADGPGVERLEDFADRADLERKMENLTIESEGRVAVATAERDTDGLERGDLLLDADDGTEASVRAGVRVAVDEDDRTISFEFTSEGTAERIVIRDDGERRGELTGAGDRETLEYEAGAEGTVQAIAVAGDRMAVVATETYAF